MRALLLALFAAPALAGPRVVVLQSDDLDAYTAPVPAFVRALGEPASIVNLHGRAAEAEAIATRLRRDDPDVVFALGAKAGWIVTQRLPATPTVFASVLDPGRYGIDTNQTTGVRATVAPGIYLSQFNSFFPEVRRVGVLRGPAQTPARMGRVREAAEAVGIELVEIPVGSPREVRRGFDARAGEVDALWIRPDREILDASTFRWLTREARRRRLPLLVETENMVAAGAMFAVVPDAEGVGVQAAGIALRLLDGAAPAVVPVQDPKETRVILNLRAARAIGVEIDPLLLDFVDVVIE